METDNTLLDRYILRQTQKEEPAVCFLPTASGDSEGYIGSFYAAFEAFRCRPSHLSLFNLPSKDLEGLILANDVVYVGGGNSRSMLALWREWSIDTILRKAWEQGVVLAGISAGSVCWFEEAISDFFPGELNKLKCLGFLPGSNCPHYDGEPNRRPVYKRMISGGELAPGIAADDGVALHYSGTELLRVVSSRPHARAWAVSRNASLTEREIVPDYLGG